MEYKMQKVLEKALVPSERKITAWAFSTDADIR